MQVLKKSRFTQIAVRAAILAAIALAGIAVLWLLGCFGYHCPFQTIFGIPCAGCGMSRAAWALLHLDFATALQMNPLIYWLLINAVLVCGVYLIAGIKTTKRWFYRPIYMLMIAIPFVVLWIVRIVIYIL